MLVCAGFFFQQGQQKLLRNSPREHNKEPEVSTRRPKFPVSQSDRATVGCAGNKSDPWSPHTPTCSTHRIHNKHHHASTGQSCFACIILKGLFSEGNKVPGTVFKARKVAGSATYKQVKQRDMLASCSRANYYYFWPSLQISQLLFPPAVTQGETNQQGHNYLWKPFRCCRGHTRRPLTYRLWTLLPDAVNPECSGTVERNNFGPGLLIGRASSWLMLCAGLCSFLQEEEESDIVFLLHVLGEVSGSVRCYPVIG